MPDSPPQPTPHHEQRFAIGVTRVCLSSGTLQIPFAMRGVFEPGTYAVRDTQRDETIELVFDPPRSLLGLDDVFTAHELQPNDEVILTVADDGLELEVKKRPRRKAPQAQGERWESVSGRQTAARDDSAPAERVRLEGGQPPLFDETQASEAPLAHEDDDAPRIVRARRIGKGDDRPRLKPTVENTADTDADERHAPPLGQRPQERDTAARRFFEDPGDPDDPYAADAMADETWQWERKRTGAPASPTSSDPALPTSGGFFAKIAQAARGAFTFRGAEADEPSSSEQEPRGFDASRAWPEDTDTHHEPQRAQAPAPREVPHTPKRDVPDMQASPPGDAFPRSSEPRPESSHRTPASRPPSTSAAETTAAPKPRNVVVEDADADTMDRFGPAMWELGEGDLRQRLIRFLQHPEVPVILRTEMVARNLGLGQEVAAAMLEDLSHDKIDGLVVTKVRDDTYRIARAPSKL